MDTVGYHFYCHIVNQINAFHRSLIFIFTAFMEARHCIIEMSGMSISCLISRQYILILSLCMPYRRQHTF